MHGRVKVRTTAEQEAIQNAQRIKKLAEYKAAMNLIFEKRKNGNLDQELLGITAEVLLKNSDINTLWNIRREIIETLDRNSDDYAETLKKELPLIAHCLRENPKSYGAWHHRTWVLDHLPEPDWQTELSLCDKFLLHDERNFHCWDYRNFVVRREKITDTEEFDFCMSKIVTNFSNYSSWHYRSKVLSKFFPDEEKKLPIREDKHQEELDLVMNAAYTDPNDTSAWFYQRWLLGCQNYASDEIWRLEVRENDAFVVLKKETQVTAKNLSVFVNDKEIECQWKAVDDKKHSKMWLAQFPQGLETDDIVSVRYNGKFLVLEKCNFSWIHENIPFVQEPYNEQVFRKQLGIYQDLAKMEPNNKWSILAKIFIMKNLNCREFFSEILQDLKHLMEIDSLRLNYYKDLRSKYVVEYNLANCWKNGKLESRSLNLSGMELTTISNEQYFSVFEEVCLDNNHLVSSLHLLRYLQNCTKLSLKGNGIKSLKSFPTLKKLKYLSLEDNRIEDFKEILQLVKRHDLKELGLKNNPCYEDEILQKIAGPTVLFK